MRQHLIVTPAVFDALKAANLLTMRESGYYGDETEEGNGNVYCTLVEGETITEY